MASDEIRYPSLVPTPFSRRDTIGSHDNEMLDYDQAETLLAEAASLAPQEIIESFVTEA